MADERWITFDCYGTLFDWQTGLRTILTQAVGDDADALVEEYHRVEAEVEAELPGASYRTILAETLGRAGDRRGRSMSAAERELLGDHWGEIPPFPDTLAALEDLRAEGWKLGILTNCDDDLFAATQASFPLTFDLVVTAQQVGNYKPDLAHFSEFSARTGANAGNWVHAAVSWWHDMEPARILGLRRVWVDREHSGHDAATVTAHIHSMAELGDVVRSFDR